MQDVIDFVMELDRLKAVTRKVKPIGLDRYENSAEHSWQIALFAVALAPYASGAPDIGRVMAMLLVHDIGEIETGDVMVFFEEDLADRKKAERAAIDRIFGMLPDAEADYLRGLWIEFEEERTVEARFAHAIDRAMPALLNLRNEGQSWRENGISHDRIVKRLKPQISLGAPALWDYLEKELEAAKGKGYFGA
ncbi:MAG: HD domain-containing protein [Novosphingobium pentaromativorans]|uniref:5'-deoxynucleotidase n=1 Tax=Novosphingobium pentaromativorans TaxID=205844 RepID=A0A2W5QNC7_9SPHN|nr:HD domain-containing protein [Novosphingobium panipatense]PZQ56153.1 MAG: HD domain-containing protein [Novosphingobium pentaromativorans]